MKGYNKWSYAPYRPFLWEVGDPYVCRVAPSKNAIHLEWLALDEGAEYEILCRRRDTDQYVLCGKTTATEFDIIGLEEDTDYVFFVRSGDKKSRVRIARCADAAGTVVNYLHPDDPCYSFSGRALCSPSLVRLPDGALLASMDVFAGEHPQNLTLKIGRAHV